MICFHGHGGHSEFRSVFLAYRTVANTNIRELRRPSALSYIRQRPGQETASPREAVTSRLREPLLVFLTAGHLSEVIFLISPNTYQMSVIPTFFLFFFKKLNVSG